jgi:hypothetical protein
MTDLRRVLHDAAAAPAAPLGPDELAARAARRLRRRRLVGAASGAAAALALAVVVVAVASGDDGTPRRVLTAGDGETSVVPGSTATSGSTALAASSTEVPPITTVPPPSVGIVPPPTVPPPPGTATETSVGTAPESTFPSTTYPLVHGTMPPPPPGTGARGVVTRGPLCPVEQADGTCGNGQPSEGPVTGATVQVFDGGFFLGSTTTDAAGRYELALAPNTYRLHVVTEQAMSCTDVYVTVKEGSFARRDISCDTGIR